MDFSLEAARTNERGDKAVTSASGKRMDARNLPESAFVHARNTGDQPLNVRHASNADLMAAVLNGGAQTK